MIKKLFALIVIVAIIVAIYFTYFPTQAQATLTIDKIYNVTEPGTTFLVNITVINAPKCAGWKIDLAWDPYILAVSTGDPNGLNVKGVLYNIYEGPFTKNVRPADYFTVSKVDNSAGIIKGLLAVYMTSGEFPEGTGVLATINFTVLRTGTTTIEITGPKQPGGSVIVDENNKEIPHVELYGLITEKSPPPIWESADFQFKVIVVEIMALSVSSVVLVWKYTPKEPKKRRKGPIYENNFVFDF
ncbi:MAG: cohesin domain-containing protein [Candidatus Bathyarchaeia archaeon]